MGISRHRKRFADPARDPPDAASTHKRPRIALAAAKRPQAFRGSPGTANDSQTPPKRKKREPGVSPGSRLNDRSSKRYSAS